MGLDEGRRVWCGMGGLRVRMGGVGGGVKGMDVGWEGWLSVGRIA